MATGCHKNGEKWTSLHKITKDLPLVGNQKMELCLYYGIIPSGYLHTLHIISSTVIQIME